MRLGQITSSVYNLYSTTQLSDGKIHTWYHKKLFFAWNLKLCSPNSIYKLVPIRLTMEHCTRLVQNKTAAKYIMKVGTFLFMARANGYQVCGFVKSAVSINCLNFFKSLCNSFKQNSAKTGKRNLCTADSDSSSAISNNCSAV